jgi:hypothetical protein
MSATTVTTTDHDADRVRLTDLLRALGASDITLRRERCRGDVPGDLAIIGKSGWIYPDGDASFMLYVETSYRDYNGELVEGSVRRWSNIKDRLGFCQVTVDADSDGTLRLDRLPTPVEADAIREALGIKRRRYLTAEALASIKSRLSARPASGPSGAPESI